MTVSFPSADEVARVVGRRRGCVGADVIASRLGIDVAVVCALPCAREQGDGRVMVPWLVLQLAQAYGFPEVARILKAGLVSAVRGRREFIRPLPSIEEVSRSAGRGGEMKHSEFAKRLGTGMTEIRAQFKRGGLPGARLVGPRVLMVPRRLLRLAEIYGLPQVERMAMAGML